MNYPLRQQILDLLKQSRSLQDICEEMIRYQENYPADFYYNQLNNIGTHDTERILTMLGGSVETLDRSDIGVVGISLCHCSRKGGLVVRREKSGLLEFLKFSKLISFFNR